MGVSLLEILAAITMLATAVIFLRMITDRETHINAHQSSVQSQREYANYQRFHGNGIAYTEVVQAIWELSSSTLPVLVISEDRFNQVTHMNRGDGSSPQILPRGVKGESSGFPIIVPPFNQVTGIPPVPFDPGNNIHMQSINPIILPLVYEHINDWLEIMPPPFTVAVQLPDNNPIIIDDSLHELNTHAQGIVKVSRGIDSALLSRGTMSIGHYRQEPVPLWERGTPAHQVMQTQVAQWLREISHNFDGRVMRGNSGEPYMIIFFY
ncbi:MAG: hypothetical protein FWE27_04940 [Defluviitaleaceae bacterium]|nr:hypothetical protein [Defluviitaleaceae bacterium]